MKTNYTLTVTEEKRKYLELLNVYKQLTTVLQNNDNRQSATG